MRAPSTDGDETKVTSAKRVLGRWLPSPFRAPVAARGRKNQNRVEMETHSDERSSHPGSLQPQAQSHYDQFQARDGSFCAKYKVQLRSIGRSPTKSAVWSSLVTLQRVALWGEIRWHDHSEIVSIRPEVGGEIASPQRNRYRRSRSRKALSPPSSISHTKDRISGFSKDPARYEMVGSPSSAV